MFALISAIKKTCSGATKAGIAHYEYIREVNTEIEQCCVS